MTGADSPFIPRAFSNYLPETGVIFRDKISPQGLWNVETFSVEHFPKKFSPHGLLKSSDPSTSGCGKKRRMASACFPVFHIKFPYYPYCYLNL